MNQTVKSMLEYLRSTPQLIAQIFVEFHKKSDADRNRFTFPMNATDAEKRTVNDNFAKASQETRQAAFDALTALGKKSADATAEAKREAEYALGRRKPEGDTNAQLLAETRMQAAWNRERPILDKTGEDELPAKIEGVVLRYVAASDADGLEGIRREIPTYLEARNDHAAGMLPLIMKRFNETLASEDPAAAEAIAAIAEADEAAYFVKMNIDSATRAVQFGESSFHLVVTPWSRRKSEVVTAQGLAGQADGF